MNVRLQYDLEFTAGIYYEDRLQMNHYSVNLQLLTQTSDAAGTNVAMDRVKYFTQANLAHSVLINSNLIERAELMDALGIATTTLPEDPVDQIIGMMLYTKFNAIMEGRMIVTALDICSVLGDSVWYQHDTEDPVGPFANPGWWHEPTPQHNELSASQNGNVVKLSNNHWREYGLEWADLPTGPVNTTIVYANFAKNET
jgi:hypothetical protein